jgi:hypothetical protein
VNKKMGAFPTKGSTIVLGNTITDIKAVLIEDPDIVVGEAENTKLTGSDGTSYAFAGQEGDSEVTMKCVITHDTITALMESVYGTGSVVSSTQKVWNLINAGGTTQDITFTPGTLNAGGSNRGMYTKMINAKGLVAKPIMELGSGWQVEMKFACDNWQFAYDSNTDD